LTASAIFQLAPALLPSSSRCLSRSVSTPSSTHGTSTS